MFLTGFYKIHLHIKTLLRTETVSQPFHTQSLKGLVRLYHVFPYLWHTCHFWIRTMHILLGQPLRYHPRIRYSECSVDFLFTNPQDLQLPSTQTCGRSSANLTWHGARCSISSLTLSQSEVSLFTYTSTNDLLKGSKHMLLVTTE